MKTDFSGLTREVKEKVAALGADLVGVADIQPLKALKVDPPDLLDPYRAAVCAAVRLPVAVFEHITTGPTQVYDNVYQTANRLLDEIAFKTAVFLQGRGFSSLPVPASQLTDKKGLYGAVSHKAVGRMAGLGWQGKNLLLITPRYGSRVRLVTVLTKAPLVFDVPLENRCGACVECVNACPAGAIKGVNTKDHYKTRNQAVDMERCYSQLKEFSIMLETCADKGAPPPENPAFHGLICGICIKACPFGRYAGKRAARGA